MSITDKLSRVLEMIEQYNVSVDAIDRIDSVKFQKELKKKGGISEDLLSELSWEDIEKCGIPTLLARKMAKIFRVESKSSDEKYISEKAAMRLSPLSLLQSFDPKDPTSAAAKRLRDISGGMKFIVFKNGTSEIDCDVSLRLLSEIQRGYAGRDSVDVDGRPVKTYAVGESSGEMVEENPLYLGRALRPDGTCDQINRSWDGVPLAVRQILYLAINKTDEIKSMSYEIAHTLRDLAEGQDAEKRIRTRYRKASTLLDELEKSGVSPQLRVKIGATPGSSVNDPFFSENRNRSF